MEEDENMIRPVAGKPISQEIPVAELMEEEDAEVATSQPQDSMTIREFIKAWKEYQLGDFKRAMRAMRTGQNTGEKAKQIQEELAPYGCHCVGYSEYSFDFHSFAGGMDWRVRNEKIHLKYGQLASELLCMYDPWSSEFEKEPDIINEQQDEPVDATEGQRWPKTCITGKSKYGNCNCCGANGVKCCAECKEDCNCRCGWLYVTGTGEEIATSQIDTEASTNEAKERTDIELLRELLERKKQLLAKCLEAPGIDKSDEHIRRQKLEVGALASMLCDLEDMEAKRINRSSQSFHRLKTTIKEQPLLMRMRPGHSGSITRRQVSGITGMIFRMGQASLSRRITPCFMTGKLMLP